ncbi:hypothetical protein ACE1CI_20885 [Aerosakkonemataceae cyanobacterium BLCC-F50]|uniref:Uncharacterized protein n=1 Tax=Floridaenema flaviceps BLCC-F50 TaxID=3153642 RepID=A0ABV4XVV4_9CYAN
MSKTRKFRLGAFIQATGHHVSAWRHPDAQIDAGLNFEHYKEIIQTAERGLFDAVFLADSPGVWGGTPETQSRNGKIVHFEPVTLFSALSAVTQNIRTEAEAREKYEFLQSLIHPEVAWGILKNYYKGVDLSKYSLDDLAPELPSDTNTNKSRLKLVKDLATRGNLTLRQLYLSLSTARGHRTILGTPESIADQLEEWFNNCAADGFNIMPPILPTGLDDFVNLVIPILQKRGLFRTEYEGRTLRENLGLRRPANRLAAKGREEQLVVA